MLSPGLRVGMKGTGISCPPALAAMPLRVLMTLSTGTGDNPFIALMVRPGLRSGYSSPNLPLK